MDTKQPSKQAIYEINIMITVIHNITNVALCEENIMYSFLCMRFQRYIQTLRTLLSKRSYLFAQ